MNVNGETILEDKVKSNLSKEYNINLDGYPLLILFYGEDGILFKTEKIIQ